MEEIVSLDNIAMDVEARDWEEAIRRAGELLVRKGSISEQYIFDMIAAVKELGPYIVLMPGLALAHSEPSPAVIRNDMSLITLHEPVAFGSVNDPVRIVMCLACTDKETHIAKLQALAMKLMKKGIIDEMMRCDSSEELHRMLNE